MSSSTPESRHAARQRPCRYCAEPIIFFRDVMGRNVPIDASSVKPEDLTLRPFTMSRHADRCTMRRVIVK